VSDGDDLVSEDDDEKLFLPKRSGARLPESGPAKLSLSSSEQVAHFRDLRFGPKTFEQLFIFEL
jgi:hypothetical protein